MKVAESREASTLDFDKMGLDTEGWADKLVEFYFFGSRYKSVLLYFEFPGWAGISKWNFSIKVGEDFAKEYRIGPGYYSLTVPLAQDIETIRIKLTSNQLITSRVDLSSKSYRVVRLAVSRISSEGFNELCSVKQESEIGLPDGYTWLTMDWHSVVKEETDMITGERISDEQELKEIFYKGRKIGKSRLVSSLRGHYGDDCFLVGSGPSISDLDLGLLQGRTVFAVNGAISLQNWWPIDIQLYMASDHRWAVNQFHLVKQAMQSKAHCFLVSSAIRAACYFDEMDLINQTSFSLISGMSRTTAADEANLPNGGGKPGFSKNIDNGYILGGTVIYVALQACFSLGFRRVFILGMDLNVPRDYAHFYCHEDKNHARSRKAILDATFPKRIEPAFKYLSQMLSASGEDFEVYNLSENSRLADAIIPKLSFADALLLSGGGERRRLEPVAWLTF